MTSDPAPPVLQDPIWESSCWTDLAHFALDDLMVVFDRRSGHTHVLDPVAAMVLVEIAEMPRSTSDLVALANQTFDCDDDIDLSDHVEMSLRQLLMLELATRHLP